MKTSMYGHTAVFFQYFPREPVLWLPVCFPGGEVSFKTGLKRETKMKTVETFSPFSYFHIT